ncbi:fatty-acid oxidation protein subunit alpha [Scytonema hofmannii PCC 7110]|uniref:Fatty-acid oxidation protein subunit alpha n=1 Tax=Scytonema hofmannii PCC 7110 TaxID=128403 RepID=A0A139XDC7_9CYAN|nr:XisI protein [Scytonema hofmannii]KYC42700.1 fatty-acid oxidation protein subunit alpha [Scytonema hofmannii PCC 7110]
MDKINEYRQAIKQILTDYSQIKPSFGDIERYTAFDNEQDHYQVISVGWENRRRVYGCLIHIDIKGDKIWIQYDGTEDGIANELVELGIPKQDIVLAYKSQFMRQYTGFTVD